MLRYQVVARWVVFFLIFPTGLYLANVGYSQFGTLDQALCCQTDCASNKCVYFENTPCSSELVWCEGNQTSTQFWKCFTVTGDLTCTFSAKQYGTVTCPGKCLQAGPTVDCSCSYTCCQ